MSEWGPELVNEGPKRCNRGKGMSSIWWITFGAGPGTSAVVSCWLGSAELRRRYLNQVSAVFVTPEVAAC